MIYTRVTARVSRALKGRVTQGSELQYVIAGGSVGGQSLIGFDYWAPGSVGVEYLLCLYKCSDRVLGIQGDVAAEIKAKKAVFPGGEVVPTRRLLKEVATRVSRLAPECMVNRCDLVIQASIHDVSMSVATSVNRSGSFAFTAQRILYRKQGVRVSLGDRLGARVPLPSLINNSWAPVTGTPYAGSAWPTRGSSPLLADSISAFLFMQRSSDGTWETLPTAYACWRLEGDSARVLDDTDCGRLRPAVLAALDTTAFVSLVRGR